MKKKTTGTPIGGLLNSGGFAGRLTAPVIISRRTYVDGCSTCERVKANRGFGPSHDASHGCESGKRDHCTCDCCF